MKSLIFTLFCTILVSFNLSSQVDIDFEVEGYNSDTLLLAYYYADKILITDTLYSQGENRFNYTSDSLLPHGMYLAVSPSGDYYYQLLVDSDDQEFYVNINNDRERPILFEGSDENLMFYEYMHFLTVSRGEIAKLDQALSTTDSTMISITDQLQKDKVNVNKMVEQRQEEILTEHPNSVTALLLKSNIPFQFPEFTGTPEELELKKYRYYKDRYFDQLDMSHPAILRTPVLDQRISYYIDNLTPSAPDSIIESLDVILGLLEDNPDAFQYYLSNFLNDYGNSKYIGMDAVYVHLALEYYGKGKADWVEEENLKEIVGNAKKLKPTLIGKDAPDFSVKSQDGTEYTLDSFNKDFTILMFWKPDCSHCTKAMPHIIEFVEKYKDESVDLLTICTKTGKDYGDCWEGVEEKGMIELLNTGDEFHRSRIFSKYYVNSTPAIYILDKEKKIKLKKVPAENLDAVMQQLMEIDAASGS
jgi:thiol-disulfide isomerase/thioredoxin